MFILDTTSSANRRVPDDGHCRATAKCGARCRSTAVLAISNIVLAPLYGVLGAAIAVAMATFLWLVACAVGLGRVSGLRTDALYLLGRSLSPRSASA